MMLRVFCAYLSLICVTAVAAPQPSPVITTTVQRQAFVESIEALGTLKANEAVTLSATVTETVSAVHFDDGQKVKKGDVLVEMTSDEEQALLAQAQAAANEAKNQYERVQSLAKTNVATASVLDERFQAYESTKAQLLAVQSRLQDRSIVAPFDGVVGLRNISVGTLVTPGDTITNLDDISTMKLDMSLPAVFLGTLKPGISIRAKTRDLNDQVFNGEITALDSRIDPNTRSIVVRALISNADGLLKPGMLMTVSLQKSATQSLILPEEALIQEGFKSFVYRVNEGTDPLTVSKQEVDTGPRHPGKVVILSGLNVGDRVVTHGVMRLSEGSTVTITGQQTGEESLPQLLQKSEGAAQ